MNPGPRPYQPFPLYVIHIWSGKFMYATTALSFLRAIIPAFLHIFPPILILNNFLSFPQTTILDLLLSIFCTSYSYLSHIFPIGPPLVFPFSYHPPHHTVPAILFIFTDPLHSCLSYCQPFSCPMAHQRRLPFSTSFPPPLTATFPFVLLTFTMSLSSPSTTSVFF